MRPAKWELKILLIAVKQLKKAKIKDGYLGPVSGLLTLWWGQIYLK